MVRAAAIAIVCALLISCAADRHLHEIGAAEAASVPRVIALEEEQSISTVHLPAGTYHLHSEDDRGYYYRSPRLVVKQTFAGAERYEGGLFLPKKGRALRGYIVWAGGRTKLGDLSRAKYSFGD